MVSITKEISQRFKCIGLLCAFLVVCIHVPTSCMNDDSRWIVALLPLGICRVAVPFFFFSAGFFFAGHIDESGWWLAEIKKRIRSLLIPYGIWGVLYSAMLIMVAMFANQLLNTGMSAHENIMSYVNPISIFGLDLVNQPCLKLLWFVRALFVFVVLSPLIKVLSCLRYGVGVIVLCAMYLFGLDAMHRLGVPTGLFEFGCLSFEGLFFFLLGISLRKNNHMFDMVGKISVVFLPIGLLLLLCPSTILCHQWLSKCGIALTVLGGRVTPVSQVLVKYSWLSFPVYIVHRFLLLPVRACFYVFTGESGPTGACAYLAACFVCFVAAVAVCIVIVRFMPRFSCVLFGGRTPKQ